MLLLRHRQKGSGRTVEAGHYVVLAAITSKFIWAPERKNKQKKKMVEKKQRKEKRWIYAKKEAPSVWTDMTWWVHFQKLNLGLLCQNGSRCWEHMSFAPWKWKEIPPLKNQPKPNQSNPDQSVFRDVRQKFTIPNSRIAFRVHFPQGSEDTRFVHHLSPWVCFFRIALNSSLPNKKAASVCNTNASANGWKDQK